MELFGIWKSNIVQLSATKHKLVDQMMFEFGHMYIFNVCHELITTTAATFVIFFPLMCQFCVLSFQYTFRSCLEFFRFNKILGRDYCFSSSFSTIYFFLSVNFVNQNGCSHSVFYLVHIKHEHLFGSNS